MLDGEGLLAVLSELIPGKSEDAIAINTVLANKLTPRIAPHVWRTYRKEHGTLREFLAAHPAVSQIVLDSSRMETIRDVSLSVRSSRGIVFHFAICPGLRLNWFAFIVSSNVLRRDLPRQSSPSAGVV